jgi:hypothetical protein
MIFKTVVATLFTLSGSRQPWQQRLLITSQSFRRPILTLSNRTALRLNPPSDLLVDASSSEEVNPMLKKGLEHRADWL